MLSAQDEAACVTRLRIKAPGTSALFFNAPLYLVGGALDDTNPRDLDVVIVLPDKLFVACYGDTEAWDEDTTAKAVKQWEHDHDSGQPERLWLRWARDCAKVSERLTRFCHRRVDFKVQPESYASALEVKPRRQLWPEAP